MTQLLFIFAVVSLCWVGAMTVAVGWILYRKFGTRAARGLSIVRGVAL